MADGHCVDRSWALYERACRVIPMGTQTHSKTPRARGVEPCFVARGEGCRLWDVDGNVYIDFRCALGPVSLGYAHPEVIAAVREQIGDGAVYSYAHPLEVDVAEGLVAAIPCAESVRFLKTGGEAMAAAHRLARGFTGRDVVITCGYHGWVNTVSRPGVPEAVRSVYRALPWGDAAPFAEAFRALEGQVAAVSVACDYATIEKGAGFLRDLRGLCDEHGALLVFDEIVTGFRLARGGAQEYFGVTPDLAVFAKAISNGFPLSCYLGRREVMEKVRDVVISSTFGGDTTALAAAKAVLSIYEREPVVETIWARGRQLHDGFRAICRDLDVPADFRGLAPLGALGFTKGDGRDGERLERLTAECLRRGVIIWSVCYTSYAHKESDIAEALGAVEAGMRAMRQDGLV
jgi:glutamate-1-semialdehyde aminotransferase